MCSALVQLYRESPVPRTELMSRFSEDKSYPRLESMFICTSWIGVTLWPKVRRTSASENPGTLVMSGAACHALCRSSEWIS